MALLQSELERLKFESGYNLLTLSALPYAIDGITQIFEQVVQPYLQFGALSYSTTPVTATVPPVYQQMTLTLASTAGMSQGDRIVVDQDLPQEFSHIETIVGNTITCSIINSHSGSYPVTVEGGESIVRGLLKECVLIQQRISRVATRAGVKRVDDVELYQQTTEAMGPRAELLALQRYWRNELCSALGLPNLREERAGSGQMLENH